ncbi:hypothetical protein TWF718_008330 [Orbilia javanica]|uniref:Uncharacterized protein n=1 Tax=Orbilia javanica TaxID=47235 RepID=A0AAN8MWT6_9PEZI
MNVKLLSLITAILFLINQTQPSLAARISLETRGQGNKSGEGTEAKKYLVVGKDWKIGSPRRICRLGLYNWFYAKVQPEYFEMTPLSLLQDQEDDYSIPEGLCYNIKDLVGSKLEVSTWWSLSWVEVVQGYCTCIFYKDHECGASLSRSELKKANWTAHNIFWMDHIKPKSFKCFKDNGWEAFKDCAVEITNGVEIGGTPYSQWENGIARKIADTYTKEQIDQKTGQGDCRKVVDDDGVSGMNIRAWKVDGCTCHFFADDSCKERFITYGTNGADQYSKFEVAGNHKILSYRCDLPWGYDTHWHDKTIALVDWKGRVPNKEPHGVWVNYKAKPNDQFYSRKQE